MSTPLIHQFVDEADHRGFLVRFLAQPPGAQTADLLLISNEGLVVFCSVDDSGMDPAPAMLEEVEYFRRHGVSIARIQDLAQGRRLLHGIATADEVHRRTRQTKATIEKHGEQVH